ncbi:hypothetical protein LTR36_006350 [Oleoguttula mirabilis]|uniref:Uncharacterized protein n=1 Tax=Oleoguttula mirabilis TaxID=1507867 RepID=A0AAV9JUW8_9PEZI|nr:hypothetical protein LTR36_006350 [Oleoguttula mirabilis]
MARSLVRLGALFAFLFLIWIISYTFEPRKTAYSCRTFWYCIGVSDRHGYAHPLPSTLSLESEVTLRDGTVRYRRATQDANPELLFLALIQGWQSWSSDFRSTQRTANDFMDLLASTKLDLTKAALAIMTASADEYERTMKATARLPFARTDVYLREDEDLGVKYEDRHDPRVQLARRANLALLRNYLMLRGLQDEQHIIWLDADVVELSENIIQTMISHSESNRDVGIITAICHQNEMANYDKNAWKIGDTPELLRPVADGDRDSASAELVATRLMLPELINGTDDSALVAIDSVGGTLLYVRAELVRKGVSFPPFNIVGTSWSQAGWIGVETEGICYIAKALRSGGCYVLGGKHHVRHIDWG